MFVGMDSGTGKRLDVTRTVPVLRHSGWVAPPIHPLRTGVPECRSTALKNARIVPYRAIDQPAFLSVV
ncbi:MAG TPA: hypothetical protein VGR20_08705, partial [Acidimicrobiia bacterium]|nr:hypothetical protein [Acidimicrobiia bacterium]